MLKNIYSYNKSTYYIDSRIPEALKPVINTSDTTMNTKWQIIIACLFLQAFIIGGIVGSFESEFSGQYGYFSYVIIYAPVAIGAILLSCLIFFLMRKNNPGIVSSGVIVSLCVWFFIPLMFIKIKTLLRESKGSNEIMREQKAKSDVYHENLRKENVRVAEKMGLTSYTWIPVHNLISTEIRSGKLHNFRWQQNNLAVWCEIPKPPTPDDTLSWLNLTLKEAAVYLGKDYKIFDSCVRAHDFDFSKANQHFIIFINIYPLPDKSKYLRAVFSGERNDEYYGNLSIQMSYDSKAR